MTLRSDARGVVMVETLIAFVPLFTLFLGIVQYALLAVAQLVVHHAAVAGVRSASVVLDDDPAYYDDAAELSIEGARLSPIQRTVHAKLAAIVPAQAARTLEGRAGQSVLDGLGTSPAERLQQASRYLPVTTAITFPRQPASGELFEAAVDPAAPLTVRVTHLATCTVPLVSAFMCRTLGELRSSEADAGRMAELRRAPEAQRLASTELDELRARIFQAEASMPLQDAPYAYSSAEGAP